MCILCVHLTLASALYGQYFWDFSEADQYPEGWLGDTADYAIDRGGRLILLGSDEGRSSVFYPIVRLDTLQWSWEVEMDFSPSQQNGAEFLLWTRNVDLPYDMAVAVRIGDAGSPDPIWMLWYRDHQIVRREKSAEPILSGSKVHVRLHWAYDGEAWQAEAIDLQKGVAHVLGRWRDSFAFREGYVGLVSFYTPSRRGKIWWDNVAIGDPPPDTLPPQLVGYVVHDAYHLTLLFDEPIDASSVHATSVMLNDAAAEKVQVDSHRLYCQWRDSLPVGMSVRLVVFDIADAYRNVLASDTLEFAYIYTESPEPFDVLFTEVMFDPSPPVGLPVAEFVELYNRSKKYIDLSELYLRDNARAVELPSDTLEPGEIVLLCDERFHEEFEPYGRVVAVKGFPSLNNDGEELVLEDVVGNTIDFVAYAPAMIREESKREGGWSIEPSDMAYICRADAWRASKSLEGGTPGRLPPHSIYGVDSIEIRIDEIAALDAWSVTVRFNQKILPLGSTGTPTDIQITERNIRQVYRDYRNPFVLHLELESPMEEGHVYGLTIARDALANCTMRRLGEDLHSWLGIPVDPDVGDVLINEVLFNPLPDGVDFVEIVNVTDSILRLDGLRIGNIGAKDTVVVRALRRGYMLPGQIIALTPQPWKIRRDYPIEDGAHIWEAPLPPLPDRRGNVSLLWGRFGQRIVLDAMDYSEDMHRSDYVQVEGVSLERVSTQIDSEVPFNWVSGLPQSGYATPGYANANALPVHSDAPMRVWLDREVFSPDRDTSSLLWIHYSLADGEEARLSCAVYTTDGVLVRRISEQLPVGRRGFLYWDGRDERGQACRSDIYIIFVGITTTRGRDMTAKLPVVLRY